jgi:hypothetical protein
MTITNQQSGTNVHEIVKGTVLEYLFFDPRSSCSDREMSPNIRP